MHNLLSLLLLLPEVKHSSGLSKCCSILQVSSAEEINTHVVHVSFFFPSVHCLQHVPVGWAEGGV